MMINDYATTFYHGAIQGFIVGVAFFLATYGLTVGFRLLRIK